MFKVSTVMAVASMPSLYERQIFKYLGAESSDKWDGTFNLGECLKVWVYSLIRRVKYLSGDQQQLLFEEFAKVLPNGTDEHILQVDCAGIVLIIGDSRYATWAGLTGYLDLETGQVVQKPQRDILESIGYNILVLLARNIVSHRRLEAHNADQQQPIREGTTSPGDNVAG